MVTTPKLFSHHNLNQFLLKQTSWVQKQRSTIAVQPTFGVFSDKAWLLGKIYQLSLSDQVDVPSVKVEPKSITVYGPKHTKNLNQFLKNSAHRYLAEQTQFWSQRMALEITKLDLREMSSRWGSCSSSGRLCFNWRLIHAPPEIIDYVIIHELAHRVHMNHSKQFWNLVGSFDSQYKQHRRWLKNHRLIVEKLEV